MLICIHGRIFTYVCTHFAHLYTRGAGAPTSVARTKNGVVAGVGVGVTGSGSMLMQVMYVGAARGSTCTTGAGRAACCSGLMRDSHSTDGSITPGASRPRNHANHAHTLTNNQSTRTLNVADADADAQHVRNYNCKTMATMSAEMGHVCQ